MRKVTGTALLVLMLIAIAPFHSALAAGSLDVVRVELAEKSIPPGMGQMVQITLGNTGKERIPAGLKVDLLDARMRRMGSPMTRSVVIPAKDEIQVLFRFLAPNAPGNYTVRFEAYQPDFKRALIRGKPVFLTPFKVGFNADQSLQDKTNQAGLNITRFSPPTGLKFELPDLLWENIKIQPEALLVGEKLKIKADLRNVGGDLARSVHVNVNYFNIRTPKRLRTISKHIVHVLAPGEKLELEFETVLPENTVIGTYRIALQADVGDRVEESNEENNTSLTLPIRLTKIKLIFPKENFSFDEAGLFLFRWDTLSFDEFKVQVGTDAAFNVPGNFFDLPQGAKWTKDREIVPLEGELPAMAQGLMEKTKAGKLYWRVSARNTKNGKKAVSRVYPFTIKPERDKPAAKKDGAAKGDAPPKADAPDAKKGAK